MTLLVVCALYELSWHRFNRFDIKLYIQFLIHKGRDWVNEWQQDVKEGWGTYCLACSRDAYVTLTTAVSLSVFTKRKTDERQTHMLVLERLIWLHWVNLVICKNFMKAPVIKSLSWLQWNNRFTLTPTVMLTHCPPFNTGTNANMSNSSIDEAFPNGSGEKNPNIT